MARARSLTLVVAVAAACAAAGPAAPAPNAPSIDVVVTGLEAPWAIDFAADGRVFLTERPGRVRVVRAGQLQAAPWMTLDVADVGEAGLMGFALDPQFAQNRFAYLAYTYRAASGRLQNRLVRVREDAGGRGTVDRVLVDDVPGATSHDGGRVKVGPDGRLYWTMGDAQNANAAQDPSSPSGKILRVNTDGTVPADNPFPNSPVYSIGHRNPQGIAWQPGTRRLYATEHGPSGGQGCCRDEVNYIEPGRNYGWPVITGDERRDGMLPPVVHSGTTTTWAPAGAAFVSRGPWAGAFLFAGLRGQALYRITLDGGDPPRAIAVEALLQVQFGRLRDVVEGPDGVYVLTNNRDRRGAPAGDDDRVLRLTWR